jgi:hypothetical protein
MLENEVAPLMKGEDIFLRYLGVRRTEKLPEAAPHHNAYRPPGDPFLVLRQKLF